MIQKLNDMIDVRIKQHKQMIKELQSMRREGVSEEAHPSIQADTTESAIFDNVTVNLVIPQPAKKDPEKVAEKRRRRRTKQSKSQLVETADAKGSSSATGLKQKDGGSGDGSDDTDLVSAFLPFVMACQKATEHRIRERPTEGALQIRQLLRESEKAQRERRIETHPNSEKISDFIDVVPALPYIFQAYEKTLKTIHESLLSKKTVGETASMFPDLRFYDPDPDYKSVLTLSFDSLSVVIETILSLPLSVTGFELEDTLTEIYHTKKRCRPDGAQLREIDLNITWVLLIYGWPSISV